jgi:predicted dehydrogenase
MGMALGVGLVGYGYWGPNLARNLATDPATDLRVVCDTEPARRAAATIEHPSARVVGSFADVLAASDVDAVVIATAAGSHAGMAREALAAGKHVLVEKPLAMTARECDELGRLADDRGLVLMVGHTFLYNAAVRWLRDALERGELGDVLYVYTNRLNLGHVRDDVNALWNLAPHDVSILLYLLGEEPVTVSATGRGYVRHDVEDVVFVTLEFPGGCLAHVHVSWLDPRKVRQVTVVGTEKMVIYDDVDVDARIKVYDKGIDVVASAEAAGGRRHENFGEFQTVVRSGDVLIPRVELREPLRVQCEEFAGAVAEHRRALTDAAHAAAVVRVLEAAGDSLLKGGERVTLR